MIADRVKRIQEVMARPHRGDECPGDADVEFLLTQIGAAEKVVEAARQVCKNLNAEGKVYGELGALHIALAGYEKKQS